MNKLRGMPSAISSVETSTLLSLMVFDFLSSRSSASSGNLNWFVTIIEPINEVSSLFFLSEFTLDEIEVRGPQNC
jgi:hypothetical protein